LQGQLYPHFDAKAWLPWLPRSSMVLTILPLSKHHMSEQGLRWVTCDTIHYTLQQSVIIIIINRVQELSNLLHNKKYIDAIGLAITLDQPWRLLKIFKGEKWMAVV
jgi:hypothetical protein